MRELVEVWKPIMGYEGLYEVSNLGRVKSFAKDKNGKIMSPCDNSKGYKYVTLGRGSKHKYYIHRLVALHFIPNPENKPEIDHINGNPSDNRVENLRWATKLENMNNPITNKRMSDKKKGCEGNNKTSVIQFDLEGNLIKKWDKIKDAVEATDTNRTSIISCANGRYKTAGNSIWKYYDIETYLIAKMNKTIKDREKRKVA